ncbi:MAG: T9SS type A sorting domain-containing protein, partial [Calditrichales bacterium]
AVRASCDLEACHPANAMNNDIPSHSLHQGKVHCNACHVQTVSTCYSCHFESMAVSGTARYYGDEPAHGFVMLVNSDKYGQVSTASYQTLTFGDSAFYAIAPDFSHTISTTARTCLECHKNESVNEYFNTGNITVTDWDETSMGLTHRQGAIPVSPDWQTSLKFDFLTYTGSANDPAGNGFDPAKWTFLKSQTDRAQMLFASPLTTEQMNALVFIFNRVTDEIAAEMPLTYQLEKNHPNPFNPSTRISFQLPYDKKVRLVIYNALGQKIRTLVDSDFQPGHYQVEWNGNDSQDNAVASGIYFYRMDAGSFSEMKKMILLR